MTYKEFLKIVRKNRRFNNYVFMSPISVKRNAGRMIGLENEKVFLSVDIGPGPEEIDITNLEIDPYIALKEVFENYMSGVNR